MRTVELNVAVNEDGQLTLDFTKEGGVVQVFTRANSIMLAVQIARLQDVDIIGGRAVKSDTSGYKGTCVMSDEIIDDIIEWMKVTDIQNVGDDKYEHAKTNLAMIAVNIAKAVREPYKSRIAEAKGCK